MTNSTATMSIGSGEVLVDELIQSLMYLQSSAQDQITQFMSSDNEELKILVSRASEDTSKRTAERVVLRNSVKRDIARRLAEELAGNAVFMDELGRQIINIHAEQSSTVIEES